MHTLSSHYEAPFPSAKCKRYSKQRGSVIVHNLACTWDWHLHQQNPSLSCLSTFIYLLEIHKKIKLNLNPHSNLPDAPTKASVQCGSIHDDGVFNVISAVTWGDTGHQKNLAANGTPRLQRAGAAEMLMTATEAFCPAPKWWKFTRFLSRTDMNWSWTI